MIRKDFPFIFFFKAHDRFTSGIPDLILCVMGRFVAIELKFGKGKATPLQDHVITKINLAKGCAAVCRNLEEVRHFLRQVIALIENERKGVAK